MERISGNSGRTRHRVITASVLFGMLAAAAAGCGMSPPDPSATGVGIQVGNVCLAAPARPGGSYQPGPVYVANTGSGTEAISLPPARCHPGGMPGRFPRPG